MERIQTHVHINKCLYYITGSGSGTLEMFKKKKDNQRVKLLQSAGFEGKKNGRQSVGSSLWGSMLDGAGSQLFFFLPLYVVNLSVLHPSTSVSALCAHPFSRSDIWRVKQSCVRAGLAVILFAYSDLKGPRRPWIPRWLAPTVRKRKIPPEKKKLLSLQVCDGEES